MPIEGGPDAVVAAGHGPVKARMTAMFEVIDNPELDVERDSWRRDEAVFIAVRVSAPRQSRSGLKWKRRCYTY